MRTTCPSVQVCRIKGAGRCGLEMLFRYKPSKVRCRVSQEEKGDSAGPSQWERMTGVCDEAGRREVMVTQLLLCMGRAGNRAILGAVTWEPQTRVGWGGCVGKVGPALGD